MSLSYQFVDQPIAKPTENNVFSGKIYAADTLNDAYTFSTLDQYRVGTDVWSLGKNEYAWLCHGIDDNIPYILKALYRKGNIHNTAINIKAAMVGGADFEFSPLDHYYRRLPDGTYEYTTVQLSESEKEQMLIRAKEFCLNTGLNHYRRQAAYQLVLQGGYFGHRYYKPDAQTGLGVLRNVLIHPSESSRLSCSKQFINNEYISDKHLFCEDFIKATSLTARHFSLLQKDRKRIGNVYYLPVDAGQVFERNPKDGYTYSKYVRRLTPYRDHYGTPDYESEDVVRYIEIDELISHADHKDISDGFSANYIIKRYRTKEKDQAKELEERRKDKAFFKNKLSGAKGDRSVIMWMEPEFDMEGKPVYPQGFVIEPIPSTFSPERYNILREERTTKQLSAHGIVSPAQVGLSEPKGSGFSSQAEYLIAAQSIMMNNTIKPYQKLIEEDIQQMYIDAGILVKVNIKNTLTNFRQMTDTIAGMVLSTDEIRGRYDIPKMTDEVAREVFDRQGLNQNTAENGL